MGFGSGRDLVDRSIDALSWWGADFLATRGVFPILRLNHQVYFVPPRPEYTVSGAADGELERGGIHIGGLWKWCGLRRGRGVPGDVS